MYIGLFVVNLEHVRKIREEIEVQDYKVLFLDNAQNFTKSDYWMLSNKVVAALSTGGQLKESYKDLSKTIGDGKTIDFLFLGLCKIMSVGSSLLKW